MECSILKIDGSEVLDYVADEGVQIYGGYGFSADYPMDRAYRDARINRIFEGTNGINRMLMVDMILKKGMKGELDLLTPLKAIQEELMSIPAFGNDDDSPLAAEKQIIANLKKVALMIAGQAVQQFMATLQKEQEILMNVADIATRVYIAESGLLRAEKELTLKGEAAAAMALDLARVNLHEAIDAVAKAGKDAISAMGTADASDQQRMLLMGLKRFTKAELFNSKDARQRIAKAMIEANGYPL